MLSQVSPLVAPSPDRRAMWQPASDDWQRAALLGSDDSRPIAQRHDAPQQARLGQQFA
jgi:hypothetical protein